MTKDDFIIRLETKADHREVEHVTREAFWNHHVPGCDEHYLAHILRKKACFLPELDYIAEQQGHIVGNIMYTRAKVIGDDGMEYSVISFGPVSVLPDWQDMGVGSILIRHTLDLAREQGHTAVLIYGDPAYYQRFGFIAAQNYGIASSDNYYCAALQALELVPDALSGKAGRFEEDKAYQINETSACKFDLNFPPKEKLKGSPTQTRFQELVSLRTPRKVQ